MTLPSYDLLRVLVAVGESQSLAEAAEKLSLSQPGVSVKLKQLEEKVAIPLFFTRGRRKLLTNQGLQLYELAKAQGEALQRSLESLVKTFGDPKNVTIRVGARPDIFNKIAPTLLKFEGKIEHRSLSSSGALRALIKGELDFCISYLRPDIHDIFSKKLFVSKPVLAFHRRWTPKSPEQLALKVPALSIDRHGHILRKWFEQLGLPADKLSLKFVCEDWQTLIGAVEKGVGYAVVPDHMEIGSDEVTTWPLRIPEVEFTYYLLYRREMKQFPTIKGLLEGL